MSSTHANTPEAGSEEPVEAGLLVEERRRRICDLLRVHGRVTVEELSRRFSTSAVTVRRLPLMVSVVLVICAMRPSFKFLPPRAEPF